MRVCVCVLDNVKVINVANDREVIVDHLNSFPNSQFSRTAEAERERKEEIGVLGAETIFQITLQSTYNIKRKR